MPIKLHLDKIYGSHRRESRWGSSDRLPGRKLCACTRPRIITTMFYPKRCARNHRDTEGQYYTHTHTHTMRTHMRSQRSTLGHRGTDNTIAGTRECTWEQTSRSTQVTQEASYDFHVPSWTNTMKGPGYLPGDRATGLWVPVLVAVAPYREFLGTTDGQDLGSNQPKYYHTKRHRSVKSTLEGGHQ